MSKDVIVTGLPIVVLLGGLAATLWFAWASSRLYAILRQRHTDIWIALGKPGDAGVVPLPKERRQLYRAAKRFVLENRYAPTGDMEVDQLCAQLRLWYFGFPALFMILGIGSVFVALAIARS